MDPVTAIGLAAAAAMFLGGVALVFLGLRAREDRLPRGADAVLAAVESGRLHAAVGARRASSPAPARAEARVRPGMSLAEPPDETPSVRLVPRESAQAGPERPKPPGRERSAEIAARDEALRRALASRMAGTAPTETLPSRPSRRSEPVPTAQAG